MTLFGKAVFSIIVLMVVGGGYYAYKTKNSAVPTTPAQVEVKNNQPQGIAVGEPNPSAPAGKKIAFSQLVEQKGTYKCTVNQYVGGTETKGTVYMSEGMIRTEFSTTVQGKTLDTTMISRDGYTYSWTSVMPTMGYKVKVAQPQGGATTDTKAQASGSYSWNAEQIGDYNCEAWTVDSSKFEIPKNVTFKQIN